MLKREFKTCTLLERKVWHRISISCICNYQKANCRGTRTALQISLMFPVLWFISILLELIFENINWLQQGNEDSVVWQAIKDKSKLPLYYCKECWCIRKRIVKNLLQNRVCSEPGWLLCVFGHILSGVLYFRKAWMQVDMTNCVKSVFGKNWPTVVCSVGCPEDVGYDDFEDHAALGG